jgi:hypothetical protein
MRLSHDDRGWLPGLNRTLLRAAGEAATDDSVVIQNDLHAMVLIRFEHVQGR